MRNTTLSDYTTWIKWHGLRKSIIKCIFENEKYGETSGLFHYRSAWAFAYISVIDFGRYVDFSV